MSVESERILALLGLAVAGTFDAPKRHVVGKARRRQIDHSQAAADIQAEMVGVLKRACANTRRQTEIGIVGDGQGFFVITYAYHRRERPEYFFAIDAHGIGRFRKQSGDRKSTRLNSSH